MSFTTGKMKTLSGDGGMRKIDGRTPREGDTLFLSGKKEKRMKGRGGGFGQGDEEAGLGERRGGILRKNEEASDPSSSSPPTPPPPPLFQGQQQHSPLRLSMTSGVIDAFFNFVKLLDLWFVFMKGATKPLK